MLFTICYSKIILVIELGEKELTAQDEAVVQKDALDNSKIESPQPNPNAENLPQIPERERENLASCEDEIEEKSCEDKIKEKNPEPAEDDSQSQSWFQEEEKSNSHSGLELDNSDITKSKTTIIESNSDPSIVTIEPKDKDLSGDKDLEDTTKEQNTSAESNHADYEIVDKHGTDTEAPITSDSSGNDDPTVYRPPSLQGSSTIAPNLKFPPTLSSDLASLRRIDARPRRLFESHDRPASDCSSTAVESPLFKYRSKIDS